MTGDPMTRRCGTCRWLDVRVDQSGQKIERSEYPCRVPEPDQRNWPDSVRLGYIITRSWMGANGGKTCPAWEQYRKDGAA